MAQENKLELKIDTGFETIPVFDEDGEQIGQFKFNPSDIDIVKRYKQVVETFNSIVVPENADDNVILEISDKIKEQIDYLLNSKTSDAIFVCNPLTPLPSGKIFAEEVIEKIAGLIEQVTDKRLEKTKAKIRKATAKYHT